MKKLTEVVSTRDEFSVYGEHIANKLRSSGRSHREIAIAQNRIDQVCFNLIMGDFFEEDGGHAMSQISSRTTDIDTNVDPLLLE